MNIVKEAAGVSLEEHLENMEKSGTLPARLEGNLSRSKLELILAAVDASCVEAKLARHRCLIRMKIKRKVKKQLLENLVFDTAKSPYTESNLRYIQRVLFRACKEGGLSAKRREIVVHQVTWMLTGRFDTNPPGVKSSLDW